MTEPSKLPFQSVPDHQPAAGGIAARYDRSADDGKTRWRVNGQAFKGLAAGLTVAELCALYFSRTLLESLSGTPFRDDVESAFDKLAGALTPHMRQFLDQLPRVIASKADPNSCFNLRYGIGY